VRKNTFILIFIITSASLSGQQLPIYSQYLYNKFLINPAVAGSDGYMSISMSAREQWIGYSGAPRTVSVSMQTRLLKKGYRIKKTGSNKQVFRPKSDGKVGLGGYIFNDKNGLVQRTGFQL
jgi:type IX secretion system PorP/SprF family membrane protein